MALTPRVTPVLLALSLGVSGCGDSSRTTSSESPAPIAVRTVKAVTVDRPERLEAGGMVAPLESVLVTSRVTATVDGVHVTAGERVRAGQIVITLDAREAGARAQQAEAAHLAAESALTRAQGEHAAAAAEQKLALAFHTRIAALRARNSATPHELDEAEARLSAAQARRAAAQAAIEGARAHLNALRAAADAATIAESYARIVAPFDGLITERLADPGALAAPGTPLLRIETGGAPRVEVQVDEARARYVRAGDRVTVFLGGAAPGDDESPTDGVVTEVARAVATDQRAFTVKVLLSADEGPRSGTFARVIFTGPPRQALIVPVTAVRRQGQVASVLVVTDETARMRLVRVAPAEGDELEILAGLDAGETVVVDPPPALRDGGPVTSSGAAGAESRS